MNMVISLAHLRGTLSVGVLSLLAFPVVSSVSVVCPSVG